MGKTEIKTNKPEYLWQAILDLSKTLMYEFHYDYMQQPKYGIKVKLCYVMLYFWLNYSDKNIYKNIDHFFSMASELLESNEYFQTVTGIAAQPFMEGGGGEGGGQ